MDIYSNKIVSIYVMYSHSLMCPRMCVCGRMYAYVYVHAFHLYCFNVQFLASYQVTPRKLSLTLTLPRSHDFASVIFALNFTYISCVFWGRESKVPGVA